jgi:hypothetical protein
MQLRDAEAQLKVNPEIDGEIHFVLEGKPLNKDLQLGELKLEDSTVISLRKGSAPQQQPERRTRPKVRDATFNIFRRGRLSDRIDPPGNLDERVAVLQAIGDFSREDCVEALQNSFYDANRACMLLIGETRRPPRPSEAVRVTKKAVDALCRTTTLSREEVVQILVLNQGDEELTRRTLTGA